MQRSAFRRAAAGFTLIEALVVIAIATVLISLGVPRFREFIIISRLKSLNAQLVTDLQYARQEALTRGLPVFWSYRVVLGASGMTCYSIYTNSNSSHGADCNCQLAPGSRCTVSGLTELRSQQVPTRDRVAFSTDGQGRFAFDPATGGIFYATTDFTTPQGVSMVLNTYRNENTSIMLKTQVSPGGRPSVCSVAGNIAGYPTC